MPYLTHLLPHQLSEAVKNQYPVLIPSGCIELHGSQLPLGTDLLLVENLAKEIEARTKVVVAPSFSYGSTGYAASGPEQGTIDIDPGLCKDYAKAVIQNLYTMGFDKIIVIQHHQGAGGPSGTAFRMAAQELFNEFYKTAGQGWWTNSYHKPIRPPVSVRVMDATLDTGVFPGHAGKGETEAMMAFSGIYDMSHLQENDFPWNWNPGREASLADEGQARAQAQRLIQAWVDFLGTI